MVKKYAYATEKEEIGYGVLMALFNLLLIYAFLGDLGLVPWPGVSLSGALNF